MEDREIIQMYWNRNTQAISETADKYGSFCSQMARSLLDSPEDAEECVNDTYHRTWLTIPPQQPNSLQAYLGRIVRNLSIDRFRRERAQKRFHQMDVSLSELEECIPASGDIGEKAELDELTRSINNFLGALPKGKRVLFLRRYWLGQTVEEIAKDYGRSKNSVYAALASLRRGLKDYLAEEGILL